MEEMIQTYVASLEVTPVTASRRAGPRRDRDVAVLPQMLPVSGRLREQARALGLELPL